MTQAEKIEKKIYTYENERGVQEVWCDYYTWLFLRLHYASQGLTEEEFEEYKKYSTMETR